MRIPFWHFKTHFLENLLGQFGYAKKYELWVFFEIPKVCLGQKRKGCKFKPLGGKQGYII